MATKEASVNEAEFRNSVATLVKDVEDPDQAYKFLTRAGINTEQVMAVDIKRLKRKVDWHLLPLLTLCYMMQFLDKVALNYAGVMGLTQDLKLKGNDFSNVATALFVAYLVAEVPNAIMLNKMPVAKWLGGNAVIWGVATACTAAVTNYPALLAVRIVLGLFEAAIVPSLSLLMTQFYTKSEQAPRTNFWACGLGVGQIIGDTPHNTALAGWRIMFLTLGLITVVVGGLIFLFIPDTPMSARFLTDVEKAAILHHISSNQTGVRHKQVKWSQLRELVLDFQIWMLAVMMILITSAGGVITTYSTTLIRNFGFSPPNAALLNAPSGVVSVIACLIVGYGVRHYSNRWLWMIGCCVVTIVGGSLMSFLPSRNKGGLLAGIYLVNATIPVMFIITQWCAANVAGHTKRVVAQTIMAASFGIANLIGPQTFQAREAPQYRSAKITLIAAQASAAFLACVLVFYYSWQNKKRDRRAEGTVKGATIGQWENLTDKENSTFRYVF